MHSVMAAVAAVLVGVTAGPVDQTRVYTLELKGTFGREIAPTPVREAMDEAARLKADVILLRLDADFTPGAPDAQGAIPGATWQREAARELAGAIIPDGYEGSPRIVGWLKRAEGGAAFLALGLPELVYTPNAVHDPVVDLTASISPEKHRSLVIGRLEAVALHAGQPTELMGAMARRDAVLSARLGGPKPEFFHDSSGGRSLTGGEDLLRLDADTALALGVSSGTATFEHEVWTALGIDPAGVRHVGDSRDEMERWRRGVVDAEVEVADLVRRFNELTIEAPGGYDQRAVARTERTRMARRILELVERFDQSLDAGRMGDSAEKLRTWSEEAILKLEQQQALDKK